MMSSEVFSQAMTARAFEQRLDEICDRLERIEALLTGPAPVPHPLRVHPKEEVCRVCLRQGRNAYQLHLLEDDGLTKRYQCQTCQAITCIVW